MRVAFVGVKRRYVELGKDYIPLFNRYHLELPWYFARSGMDVVITTVDCDDPNRGSQVGKGWLDMQPEWDFVKSRTDPDVVVHWRRWFPELYRPEAVNVVNCQDHSFSPEWQAEASEAFKKGRLHGILCFPTWHRRNLLRECPWLPEDRALAGVTLGVDTDVYKPADDKDPYQMLWASDLGRGFYGAAQVAIQLFQRDKRFRLHVCYPDNSVRVEVFRHPAIVDHGHLPAGQELFDLFGRCGVLPYTSTFMEPSSRAHRQAQAAGAMVMYPPDRGSPSELIREAPGWQDGRLVGVVSDPALWVDQIHRLVENGKWREIGDHARAFAVAESWDIQAERFANLFKQIRGDT